MSTSFLASWVPVSRAARPRSRPRRVSGSTTRARACAAVRRLPCLPLRRGRGFWVAEQDNSVGSRLQRHNANVGKRMATRRGRSMLPDGLSRLNRVVTQSVPEAADVGSGWFRAAAPLPRSKPLRDGFSRARVWGPGACKGVRVDRKVEKPICFASPMATRSLWDWRGCRRGLADEHWDGARPRK